MIVLIISLFACAPKHPPIVIGIVDSKEDRVCVLQLADETVVYVDAPLCDKLAEGDVIKVTR
jgi:hypothetical protein